LGRLNGEQDFALSQSRQILSNFISISTNSRGYFRFSEVHGNLDLQIFEVELEFGSALLEDDALAALEWSAFYGDMRAGSQ
jgi:hypothetical protein